MARILVVDDSPQNLALIELYLRGSEFEVVAVTDGHAAVERALQERFDLILLDVVMPGIDGLEVCRRLKNDPQTAFVPVIFLTGRLADESEKFAAYQLGAVDYIQKPIEREELLARVRVMLRLENSRSRLDRENAALRAQLARTEQRLGDALASLGDLQQLFAERTEQGPPSVLVLGARSEVESFDVDMVHALGELRIGRPLADAGVAAARIVRIVESGVSSAALVVPSADGGERELLVGVRKSGAGTTIVTLQDVTGVRRVEHRIASRAIHVPHIVPLRHSSPYRMSDFVGSSPAVLDVTRRVDRLRQTRSTVLIRGESGTGKELVARALHFDGLHRGGPFIPLHCGAIAPELIESELFGHEKGAFTGAQQAREGLFRAADGGTIFLDEIAETPPSLQVKLLRVLQRGEVRAVGSSKSRIVDVRIMAATSRDLVDLVRQGAFREDLYYRLEVVTLHLPPLRERMSDLEELIAHFLAVANRKHDRMDRPVRGVSQGALERLRAYSWPGNVRELENVIERAFALDVGEIVQEDDLPGRIQRGALEVRPSPLERGPASAEEPMPSRDLRERREAAEREALRDALRATGGDKAAAAQWLGMARSTFYRRAKELGL